MNLWLQSKSYSNIPQYSTYLMTWCWTITNNHPVMFWNAYCLNRKIRHVYYYWWHTPNLNFCSIYISHSHVMMAITKTRCWNRTKEVTIITVLIKTERSHTKVLTECRTIKNYHPILSLMFFLCNKPNSSSMNINKVRLPLCV